MAQFDLLIRNGTIIDGTGAPRYKGDVGVLDGKIAAMGFLPNATAKKTLDAEGRLVGPGFIDTHTHFDSQIFRDPTCADAGQNGITTVVMANCGFGFAPCRPEHKDRYMMMMESVEQIPVEIQRESLPWDWQSFPDFLASLKRAKKAVNAVVFCPLNPLAIYVMGIDAAKVRAATPAEMAEMKKLLIEAMDAGAAGLSISHLGKNNMHLDYDGSMMPSDVMPSEQVVELASVLKEYGRGVVQCLTGVPGLAKTIGVTEDLAVASGRPVLHNIIMTSDMFPGVHKEQLAWLDRVNREGKDVYAAFFCNRLWSEFTLPTCSLHDPDRNFRELTYCKSNDERRAKLADPEFRERLRSFYNPKKFDSLGGVIEKFGLISAEGAEEYKKIEGRVLGDVAKERGMHIVDLYVDINLKSDFSAIFKSSPTNSTDPDVIHDVFVHDKVVVGGSDGGAHLKMFSGGSWSTEFLTWLVRETKKLTPEQAHYRMSYLPMRLMGVRDRGLLLEGMAADIVIYGLDDIYFDRSSYAQAYDMPAGHWRYKAKAGGYRWIIVNGALTFDNDEYLQSSPGQLLRS